MSIIITNAHDPQILGVGAVLFVPVTGHNEQLLKNYLSSQRYSYGISQTYVGMQLINRYKLEKEIYSTVPSD